MKAKQELDRFCIFFKFLQLLLAYSAVQNKPHILSETNGIVYIKHVWVIISAFG